MTLLKNFLGLIALTTLCFSCQKEMSLEDVKSPIIIDASWQFTESGKTFMGEIDTAFITEATGFNIITLQGTTADGTTGQIILEVAGETVGTGVYTGDFVNFLYGESGGVVYSSIAGNTAFSIVITAIDSASITGTFAGTVRGADDTEKTIFDGRFTAPIGRTNLGVILPNPDNDDYFQMGSQWVYANEADAGDMVTITAIGDTTISVPAGTFDYTIFENNRTGQHRYFRKDGNDFYEFTVARLGDATSPADVDIPILKQDRVQGDSWESDPYNITSGNLSASAKIVNSITARDDFSLVLNGFEFTNVIQVDAQLYIRQGGNYEQDGSYIPPTFYSKGIGIVRYYDYDLGGFYALKSYSF